MLSSEGSCRQTVRKFLAWLATEKDKTASPNTAAYCKARGKLPQDQIKRVARQTARRIERQAAGQKGSLWRGRRVRVADGSGLSMLDTPQNQQIYPQHKEQKPGCGFPIMRIVAIFSLATGVLLDLAKDTLKVSEKELLRRLWSWLEPNDVLLTDRGFCSYADLYLLSQRGIDSVTRKHQRRKYFTPLRRLGKNDRLVEWHRGRSYPNWLSKEEWNAIPKTLVVRQIDLVVDIPGFRTQQIAVVTTLLDHKLFPVEAVAQIYRWRWRVELFLRDIKITMGMDILRCKSPEMVEKELWMRITAYNLVRAVMFQASMAHDVPVERLSFKGTLTTIRLWAPTLADSKLETKQRHKLYRIMIGYIVKDSVPERPRRVEPRAKKRRPKTYQLLTKPRNMFKEIPHKSHYRKA